MGKAELLDIPMSMYACQMYKVHIYTHTHTQHYYKKNTPYDREPLMTVSQALLLSHRTKFIVSSQILCTVLLLNGHDTLAYYL